MRGSRNRGGGIAEYKSVYSHNTGQIERSEAISPSFQMTPLLPNENSLVRYRSHRTEHNQIDATRVSDEARVSIRLRFRSILPSTGALIVQ